MLGQIRTAIGLAQLLVDKKLKQFLGLCHNAEVCFSFDINVCVHLVFKEGKGEKRTTPDDLQGFWDMVSYQIDDVQHKFLQLEELEKNGWVVEQVAPKKKPMKVCTYHKFLTSLLWYNCVSTVLLLYLNILLVGTVSSHTCNFILQLLLIEFPCVWVYVCFYGNDGVTEAILCQ